MSSAMSRCDLRPDECNAPPRLIFRLILFYDDCYLKFWVSQYLNSPTHASSPIYVGREPYALVLVKMSESLLLTFNS